MDKFDKFLQSNSVTRQVTFNRTKISGKCQNVKTQMRHFELFSNNVLYHHIKDQQQKGLGLQSKARTTQLLMVIFKGKWKDLGLRRCQKECLN